MVLVESKKRAGLFCCAYGCKNPPAKKKGGLCHKHYKRKRRKKDPVGVRYNDMVQKAKSRGLSVHFTLEQFRAWANFNYYLTSGRRGQAATIDRRCNAHGYYLWNMQIVSNRFNASKGNSFSGEVFTREHHFGKQDESWEAAGDHGVPF